MNSLKNFKRLIIQGKESQPEPTKNQHLLTQDLKIPEIRESAYKILHRKKIIDQTKKQHSISKKQQIKLPSKSNNCSPSKLQKSPLCTSDKDIHNTQTSEYLSNGPKLKLLTLTEQQLECLQGIITAQKQTHEKRLKEAEYLSKIHDKISTLKKNHSTTQSSKQQTLSYGRSHHNSDHQTDVLSVPSSFQDFNKTQGTDSNISTHTKMRTQSDKQSEDHFYQKTDLQFKKIMYILQSKSRVVQNKQNCQVERKKQPTNSYRLIEQIPIPSISFRGPTQNVPKKTELMEIVSMLNSKYKKNIKFN